MDFSKIEAELKDHDQILLDHSYSWTERSYSCGFCFGLRLSRRILETQPKSKWAFCLKREREWLNNLYKMVGAAPGSYFDAAQDGVVRAAAIAGVSLQ